MSQINDALRRAGKAAPPAAAATPPLLATSAAAPPPLLPALPPLPAAPAIPGYAEEESPRRKSTLLQVVLAVFLVLAVGVAAVVTFWEKRNRVVVLAKPTEEPGAKRMLPPEVVKAALAPQNPAPPVATNLANVHPVPAAPAPAVTNVKAPAVAAAPVAPPKPVEPVKFPPLRLQSIFYRPSNPSVIINNKTLFLDDTIQGVQVADIQAASVTLVLSGQTNILTLR